MISTGNKLISHGSIYFLGNFLRHAVSFFMLPIYTRVLTPAEYGTIELLSMVIDFAGIIFGLRIGEAIFRFYLESDDRKKQNQVISTALVLTFILNCIGLSIIIFLSGHISTVLFGGTDHQHLLSLFSLTLLFSPMMEIPMTFIRAQQRPWLFVSMSTMKMVLQLSLNIYLVVFKQMGVTGVVIGAVIASGVMSIVLCGYSLKRTGIGISWPAAKSMILFSYPMIIASIISFYITFGDRYFLKIYGSLTDVGLYSLGYKFGFLLTFIGTGPFFAIWDSERYMVLKRSDAKQTFQRVFLFFSAFSALVVVVLSVFSKNVLMIMANPSFWSAAQIVPLILGAYFLQGWTGFCNLGIMIEKKTILITKSVILVAIVITALYLLLIPPFGAMGAAWATFVAFGTRFLYIHYHSRKIYNMELPWRSVVTVLFPCLGAIIISRFVPDDIVISLLLNIVLVLCLFYVITIVPFVPEAQRHALRRILIRPWLTFGILRNAFHPNKQTA